MGHGRALAGARRSRASGFVAGTRLGLRRRSGAGSPEKEHKRCSHSLCGSHAGGGAGALAGRGYYPGRRRDGSVGGWSGVGQYPVAGVGVIKCGAELRALHHAGAEFCSRYDQQPGGAVSAHIR